MLNLHYSFLKNLALDTEDMIALAFFPADMKEKIKQLHFEEDQKRAIGARRLLLKGMQEKGKNDFSFAEIRYHSLGKPFTENGLHFSMTHNGKMLACAIGEEEVGLDVEEMKPIDWELFRNYFSKEEWDKILRAENILSAFYQYWTVKEAVLKLLGAGMTDDLDQFCIALPNVTYNNQQYYVITGQKEGYCYAIATHTKTEVNWIKMT